MLRSLHIRNYVLIDSLDVDFPEGLIIITGQTGAGKSIVLGALSLLSGAKADASLISEGADSCVVEAEFDAPSSDGALKDIIDAGDIEWDGGHLVIRRVVAASGRSRCFVNDSPVSVGVLGELSARLIDIHSQHQSLLLKDPAFQLSLLDHFCGNAQLLSDCRAAWKHLQETKASLSEARESLARLNGEKEYVEAQFRQLDAASLREGELEELEVEQKQLSNAESIKETFASVLSLFDSFGQGQGISVALREAERSVAKVGRLVPSVQPLEARLESSRIELDDILSTIEDADSRIEVSEERLQQVDDRISLLYSLMRRHSCSTVGELIALRDSLSDSLFDADTLKERISALEKELAAAGAAYEAVCRSLRESRSAAASPFGESVTSSLRFLELESAVFAVSLQDSVPGPSGCDSVIFTFSASGRNPVEVSNCASGGEVSRIMLCLKQMMARFVGMPTMIFDEIDTGVSGSVADKMGRMICSMGADMQIFAITHLPQVAAKGSAHYVVSKETDVFGKTASTIAKVTGEARVMEIARLLSASDITPEAVANARSLLL